MSSWEEYPTNSLCNVEELRGRWQELEDEVFVDGGKKVCVRITDVGMEGNDTMTSSEVYDDETKVWAALVNPIKSRLKIISIYSKNTIEPLQMTSDLMRKILHKYNVHPDFLRILFSFGDEPHVAEASSSNFSLHTNTDESGKYTQISYQMNYVEENHREGKDPWSFRHTGIYHQHHQENNSETDLFIILHPTPKDILDQRLLKTLGLNLDFISSQSLEIIETPYSIHQIILSSFSGSWRWYFRYLGDRFSKENSHAMTVSPTTTNADFSFQRVQNLHNMNDFALFAKSCCSSNLDIVEAFKHSTTYIEEQYLNSQLGMLKGYVQGASALEGRIRNAIDLVGYTLTIHNQLAANRASNSLRSTTEQLKNLTQETVDMTEQLKNLTQDTVDDSATVKIITYVSAFYLPGSFVASIYGMSFFSYDSISKTIDISDDFWVFVLTWLPLTFITGAIYVLTLWISARNKRKRNENTESMRKTEGRRVKEEGRPV